MKLTDEFEDKKDKTGLPVLYMTIGVIAFMAIVFCIVVAGNAGRYPRVTSGEKALQRENSQVMQTEPGTEEQGMGTNTLTSDQLDFWDMYKEDVPVSNNSVSKSEQYKKNAKELLEEEQKKLEEDDLSEGGTKTKVIRPDGTEQWIMINTYLNKNGYKESGFVYEEPVLKYYENGTKASYLGVDIDEDAGNVNFSAMKKAGVDFVMLRLGYRGYESGQIFMDEQYFDYIQAANEAGLDVGIYFRSQAITPKEAMEEAEFVIANLVEMRVTYPVVFDMGLVENDTARIENLPKMQITEIANVFCRRIKEVGYEPMVRGNKYWLLRKIDLTQLGDYDIWLSQSGEVPDYPYEFAMWQYTTDGSVDGISGDVNMDISFIDYGQR